MATFTSSLPDDLLEKLSAAAKNLSVPKNKLIEQALSLYLDHLKRAEYIKSFQKASQDQDLLSMAEEGMASYLNLNYALELVARD